MSSSDDQPAEWPSPPVRFEMSAERRRTVATQFCLQSWWPMSIFLAAPVGFGSGLGLGPAVVLAVAAAAVAAGSSYLIEWTMLGRAYVEVRHGGLDVVQNRFRRWVGTLSGPVLVAPIDGTWSTPGVRMVMADSSGRGVTSVSAVALDPERDIEVLADLLNLGRRDPH